MILKYKEQSIRAFTRSAIAAGCWVLVIILDLAVNNAPAIMDIFLVVLMASCFVGSFLYYSQGILNMIKAKGYNPFWYLTIIFFLITPVLLFLMLDDASNQAKEAEEERYTGARCVSCDARIGSSLRFCPACGWTQPQRELDNAELPLAKPAA